MASSSSNDITVLSQSFEPLAKKPKITSATPIVDTWVDKLTLQQKENYDTLLANLFYRTGIPFQVIDSFAMKEFIKAVRPAYVTQMPSRKSLSGHLLDKAYGILKQKFDTWMNESKYLFVEENADVAFNRELNNFLSQFTLMDPQTKKEYFEMTPFQYWTIYGRNDFPMLQKIALRIFNVPISNASSERAWSTFDFIHTKKRNRLLNEKVKKLVFIYTNSALLDSDDPIDYLVAPINSDSD